MPGNDKFMVQLLNSISSKHLFVLTWLAVSGFFVMLMVMSYRRTVRRNFRDDGGGSKVRLDDRRLGPGRSELPKGRRQ